MKKSEIIKELNQKLGLESKTDLRVCFILWGGVRGGGTYIIALHKITLLKATPKAVLSYTKSYTKNYTKNYLDDGFKRRKAKF